MDALETEKPADAADTVTSHVNGFAIRFCPGPRPQLRFQAGIIRHEFRDYIGPGMVTRFSGNVALFHFLGHGETREEAVEMATENWNQGGAR